METLKEQIKQVIQYSLKMQDASRSLNQDCIKLRTKLLQIGNEYAPPNPQIPNKDTPMGTPVRYRDRTEDPWMEGRFINLRDSQSEYPFGVLNESNDTYIYLICEIIEDQT